MKPQPDFTICGNDPKEGLKCLMGDRYYRSTVKTYSGTEYQSQIANQIIENNTINCLLASTKIDHDVIRIEELQARTKIVEEIQDSFIYKAYRKYLHHRLITFALPNENTVQDAPTDFNKHFYSLEDRNFHWNAYKRSCKMRDHFHFSKWHNLNLKPNVSGRGIRSSLILYKHIPIPITSTDEYRYIIRRPENPFLYDKAHLVKGLIFIR